MCEDVDLSTTEMTYEGKKKVNIDIIRRLTKPSGELAQRALKVGLYNFKDVWDEYKKRKWYSPKQQNQLDDDWYYVRPGKTIKDGVEGVDYVYAEKGLVKYAVAEKLFGKIPPYDPAAVFAGGIDPPPGVIVPDKSPTKDTTSNTPSIRKNLRKRPSMYQSDIPVVDLCDDSNEEPSKINGSKPSSRKQPKKLGTKRLRLLQPSIDDPKSADENSFSIDDDDDVVGANPMDTPTKKLSTDASRKQRRGKKDARITARKSLGSNKPPVIAIHHSLSSSKGNGTQRPSSQCTEEEKVGETPPRKPPTKRSKPTTSAHTFTSEPQSSFLNIPSSQQTVSEPHWSVEATVSASQPVEATHSMLHPAANSSSVSSPQGTNGRIFSPPAKSSRNTKSKIEKESITSSVVDGEYLDKASIVFPSRSSERYRVALKVTNGKTVMWMEKEDKMQYECSVRDFNNLTVDCPIPSGKILEALVHGFEELDASLDGRSDTSSKHKECHLDLHPTSSDGSMLLELQFPLVSFFSYSFQMHMRPVVADRLIPVLQGANATLRQENRELQTMYDQMKMNLKKCQKKLEGYQAKIESNRATHQEKVNKLQRDYKDLKEKCTSLETEALISKMKISKWKTKASASVTPTPDDVSSVASRLRNRRLHATSEWMKTTSLVLSRDEQELPIHLVSWPVQLEVATSFVQLDNNVIRVRQQGRYQVNVVVMHSSDINMSIFIENQVEGSERVVEVVPTSVSFGSNKLRASRIDRVVDMFTNDVLCVRLTPHTPSSPECPNMHWTQFDLQPRANELSCIYLGRDYI